MIKGSVFTILAHTAFSVSLKDSTLEQFSGDLKQDAYQAAAEDFAQSAGFGESVEGNVAQFQAGFERSLDDVRTNIDGAEFDFEEAKGEAR